MRRRFLLCPNKNSELKVQNLFRVALENRTLISSTAVNVKWTDTIILVYLIKYRYLSLNLNFVWLILLLVTIYLISYLVCVHFLV